MTDQTTLVGPTKPVGPLDWRVAIMTPAGRPTPEFQRRWATQQAANTVIGTITGTGTPTATPIAGQQYIDTSTTPPTYYTTDGTSWFKVGVQDFIDLGDVPHSYTSDGGFLVKVNSGATGLEFDSLSTVLDSIGSAQGDILYRGSTGWSVLTPGTSGLFLKTQGAGANPEWDVAGSGTVTSVSMTVPTSVLTVSGSPVTSSGTLAISLTTQSPNSVFAGPTSGASATPAFRSLVPTDLPTATGAALGIVKPDGTTVTISGGVLSAASGANPTATASNVATNGSSTSFMRADASPAIELASTSQFGLVKVDGSTITASGGVITSIGGSTGANPTATASDTAVNGSATTFMRSDASPAVQKATSGQFGVVKVDGSTITASGGVISASGGGGGGTPPTIRGTGFQVSTASSYTVTWPSGTVSGDLAIIFFGHGFQLASIPTNWLVLNQITGSNFNGSVIAKTLTSGDITTGSVALTAGGSFGGVVAIITFHGGCTAAALSGAAQSGSATTSVIIPQSVYLSGSTGIYFASVRANGATITGSLGTVLNSGSSIGVSATGSLAAGTPTIGAIFPGDIYTFSSGNAGFYAANVIVQGP